MSVGVHFLVSFSISASYPTWVLHSHMLPVMKFSLIKSYQQGSWIHLKGEEGIFFFLAQIQRFLLNCSSKILCHNTKLISLKGHWVPEVAGSTYRMRLQILFDLSLNTYTLLVATAIISIFLECLFLLQKKNYMWDRFGQSHALWYRMNTCGKKKKQLFIYLFI